MSAGFDFGIHAHMLRHACGYVLANKGIDTRSLQAYLGHKQIQNTVRYTALSPHRFRDFWKDFVELDRPKMYHGDIWPEKTFRAERLI